MEFKFLQFFQRSGVLQTRVLVRETLEEANKFERLPLKMFNVAKQCVMISWLVRELAHRHKAMRLAQELGELNIERGVFKVFVKSDLPLHI